MQKLRPWSVKGVSEEAREAARSAAGAADLAIGAWIDRSIKDATAIHAPSPALSTQPHDAARTSTGDLTGKPTVAAAIAALESQIGHSHAHATATVGSVRDIIEDLTLRIDTVERHKRLLPHTTLFVEKDAPHTSSAENVDTPAAQPDLKIRSRREHPRSANDDAPTRARRARRIIKQVFVGTALMSSGLIAAFVAIWFAVFKVPGDGLQLGANLPTPTSFSGVLELPHTPTFALPAGPLGQRSATQLRSLAEGGDSAAQSRLAMLYVEGRALNQDYAAAAHWLTMAATTGLAEAQYNLGVIYARALGVEANPLQAAIWFQSAAEQDHVRAQYALGLAYAGATGVVRNYPEAVDWLQRAAEQGYADAQFALATLLEDGAAGPADPDGAYYWYQAAVANGSEQAAERAALLVPRLPATTTSSTRPTPRQSSSPPEQLSANTVQEIQRLLAALDFFGAAPDGVLDTTTRAAIRDYQAQLGLRVDGKASAGLLRHLMTVTSTQ
ncbi:MAG: SEL1-like repeat protein [Alphaproteobacteria bacterium]